MSGRIWMIEEARFEEKLRVEINVEDGLSCQVPSFILQPIVENAVRYGNSADGVRRVEISAKRMQSGKWNVCARS